MHSFKRGAGGGSPSIAQQPAATEQEATHAAAFRAYQEGMQLGEQRTVEAVRQAIAKFEEALPLFRAVGDRNTLLLEYSLGEDRSYLWAVTKTGITSYELPKRADIEAAAEEFKKLLQSKNADAIGSEAARKLSQMLLAPVAEQLNNQRLVIVGDGVLQTIPFTALPIPETIEASVFPEPRPEFKLRANSPSRLKTTETLTNSPLERTFAMSQGFEPLADASQPRNRHPPFSLIPSRIA